jgi:hypothetical protein
MKKILIIPACAVIVATGIIMQSCTQTQEVPKKEEKKENKHADFLKVDTTSKELFHVLLTSDEYTVAQMNFQDRIERGPDKGGDQYMCEEIKKYDIIDMTKEAVVRIWLFPDLPGRIMKIRPQMPSYLKEIDELLLDDLQRWTFVFPKKIVTPTQFLVRYRIVLRKNKSDKEILKDIKELMKKDK